MGNTCAICGLEIDSMDRMYGRAMEGKEGEVHVYCRLMEAGVVPECPLADSVVPKPCNKDCLQARMHSNRDTCGCECENVVCQIGKSVRALRSRHLIKWEGYVPTRMRG